MKRSKSLLLPFILALCLASLAAWLFVPWLLEPEPDEAHIEARTSSQAVAGLMPAIQPEHVFFSPRAHSRDSCNECHSFGEEEYMSFFNLEKRAEHGEIFYQTAPVKMSNCISCHAIPPHAETTTAGEACGTCHR